LKVTEVHDIEEERGITAPTKTITIHHHGSATGSVYIQS
jgi:hypothetical protein